MKSMCRFGWLPFLVIAVVAELCVIVPAWKSNPAGYLYGDSGFYAAAADSLLRDGDLDLLNQCFPGDGTIQDVLPALEGDHGGEFALAAKQYLTLKQSPVLSVAVLPFYSLFGQPGCLLFNLLVLNLLLVGMAQLAGGGVVSRIVTLLALVTTPLIRFAFNFSPDLFLCLLLVGCLLAARQNRPGLAGILAGLAVSSKLYVALLVMPIPLLLLLNADRRWHTFLWLSIGGVIGLTPGLAFNTWQYGAPWITGYERQLLVENGVIGLANHTSRFTEPPLQGLRNILFDDTVGLWPTAPLWFLWPIGVAWIIARRTSGSRWVFAAVAIILMNLVLFATYDGWHGGSSAGNRYLFPALVMGFVVIGAALQVAWNAICTDHSDEAKSADSAA